MRPRHPGRARRSALQIESRASLGLTQRRITSVMSSRLRPARVRSSTMIASSTGVVACPRLWRTWLRSSVSVRPRQRRIVVSETPQRPARTATGSVEPWISARTFGVVVALA
jgi:hypothetical protein